MCGALGNLPRVVPAVHRKPLWLYPNLLSLDAPLVAVAWLHVFARTWRQYLPWQFYASLGLAVWAIYAADRLLDVSLRGDADPRHEARHEFHRRHRKAFVIALVVAVVLTTAMVVATMPTTIYYHILLGGVLVAGFFGLSMLSSQSPDEVPHLKNILAGATFAFGTAMCAHIYRGYGIYDLVTSREFLSFAILCVLNVSAIDLWEHASRSADIEIKASDELALTLPLTLLGGAALGFAVMDGNQSVRPFYYAILTGAALLYALNRSRSRFSIEALRALADVALLVPVLVFQAAAVA